MKRFQDKVCVITASASGIGFAIARKFGKEGGKIVISSRNMENVSKAVEELRKEGIVCEGTVCHVSKDRKKLVDFAIEKFGKIEKILGLKVDRRQAADKTHYVHCFIDSRPSIQTM